MTTLRPAQSIGTQSLGTQSLGTRALRGALVGAAGAAAAAGLVTALLGAVSDTPAALGALVGAGLALAVLASGAFAVDAVARILPAASLLVALLTYTLQVVVLGLAFVALSGSGLLEERLDRAWLGGAVAVTTLVWVLAQVVLATRARIPAYDLPEAVDR